MLESKIVSTQKWLIAVAVLVAAHTYRQMLFLLPVGNAEIYVEFRGWVIFLMDFPLTMLIAVFLYSLLRYSEFRQQYLYVVLEISKSWTGVCWFLLVGWAGVSVTWSVEWVLVVYGLYRLFVGMIVATIVAYFVKQDDFEVLIAGILIGGLLHGVVAIFQVIKGSALGIGFLGELAWHPDNYFNLGETTFRAYGLTVHPNNLAGYLIIALFACLFLLNRRRVGFLGWIIWWLLFLSLLATQSRTGIVAVSVIFLAMLGFAQPHHMRYLRYSSTWLVIIALALAAIFVLSYVADNLIYRFGRLIQQPALIWPRVRYAFEDTEIVFRDSYVLGVGLNNLMMAIAQQNLDASRLFLPAHNAYFVIWTELGIPGFVLFVSACILVIINLVQLRSKPALALWAICLLAICLTMLLDYYFWLDYRSQLMLFWLLGMFWGTQFRLQRRDRVLDEIISE